MDPFKKSCSDEDFRVLLNAARQSADAHLGQLLDGLRPYLQHVANQELDSDLKPKLGGSDLVQQTFMEAHQDFDKFDGSEEADLRRWLTRILRNNLEDARRRYHDAKMRTNDRELPGSATLADQSDKRPSPLGVAIQQERVAAVRAALATFPPGLQELIRLRQQEGKTFGEIAAVLGMSEEAARKQWSRAVTQLQEKLGESDANPQS